MLYCMIVLIVCTLLYVYMAMNIVTMFYANKVFVLYCILRDSTQMIIKNSVDFIVHNIYKCL